MRPASSEKTSLGASPTTPIARRSPLSIPRFKFRMPLKTNPSIPGSADPLPPLAPTIPASRIPISPPKLSPIPSDPPSTNVFARLQALFPHADTPGHSVEPPKSHVIPSSGPNSPAPKLLKVRIISWNMHDSLPKGDLETLLGVVPRYHPKLEPSDSIPDFGESEQHPYHIVVVAGQECPSVSGLPMAFGAGYKVGSVLEKDKEKRAHKKRKGEDDKRLNSSPRETLPLLPPDPFSPPMGHSPSTSNLDSTANQPPRHSAPHPGGWSSVLEDWFVRGVGSVEGVPSIEDAIPSEQPSHSSGTGMALGSGAPHLSRAFSDSAIHQSIDLLTDAASRTTGQGVNRPDYAPQDGSSENPPSLASFQQPLGSYELACKERMMGIYLAVYIHRDVMPFVRGADKDSVTAGLIGGRLGNKGGVGISLNIAGTSFLFINAHLAAHEGRAQLRMANLAKIKAELSLNSYLETDDPRSLAEDITDQFDYSFLCGDLNFRLQVSRLHAEWLLSRKEYGQALEFDQLRGLMRSGQFPGFEEGPINFDCTFKYNVPGKSPHHQLSMRNAIKRTRDHLERDRRRNSTKAESADIDHSGNEDVAQGIPPVEEDEAEAADGSGDEPDRSSVTSTFRESSFYSGKDTADMDHNDSWDNAEYPAFSSAVHNTIANARISAPSTATAPLAIKKIFHHPAARKAKQKWFSLVFKARSSRTAVGCESERILPSQGKHIEGGSSTKSPSNGNPNNISPIKGDLLGPNRPKPVSHGSPSKSDIARSSHPGPMTSGQVSVDTPNNVMPKLLSPTSGSSREGHTVQHVPARSGSSKTPPSKSKDRDSGEDDETSHGVYDSSSKQRVPSWCDRILFKSTVVPDPEEEISAIAHRGTRGYRMGQFLANTFFHRTSRPRRDSSASSASSADSNYNSPRGAFSSRRGTYGLPSNSGHASNWEDSVNLPSPDPHRPINGIAIPHRSKTRKSLPVSPSLTLVKTPTTPPPTESNNDFARYRKRSFSFTSFPLTPFGFKVTPPEPVRSPLTLGPDPSALPPSGSQPMIVQPTPASSREATPARRWFFPRAIIPSGGGLQSPEDRQSSSNSLAQRKGEIRCLSYNTLDDQAMARLRGKSDHRPIIGTYSICLE